MATKIYKSGNYIIVDDSASLYLEIPTHECDIVKETTGSTTYRVLRNNVERASVSLSNIVDASDASYTESAFDTFRHENTGFNSAAGGSVAEAIEANTLATANAIGGSSSVGAFGEQIFAELTPEVQIANKYQIDPANLNELEIFEATGGSSDNNGNLFRCQTGTSVGGYGVIRSKNDVVYRAGEGIEARFTAKFTTGVANSLQFGGMFSLTETVAFGYDGANFSCLHSYGGAAETQLITITATGAGTCNVTLDDDLVAVSVTSSDVQTNAREIADGLEADGTVSAKWRVEQVDDKVYVIAKSVGDKTGTFSISGGVTASIAEQTAGVAKTDGHIAQSSWNITTDPFTGFDPTQLNVYKITFGYLGVANITYSIYNPSTGKFVAVHQIEWSNANTTTHLGNPNLKMGWTAASLGSTTALTVEGASAFAGIQGKRIVKTTAFAADASVGSVGTSLAPILTIKNRVVYGDRFNLSKIEPLQLSVDNDHTKGTIIEVYINATLSGENYQFEDEFNSVAVYDSTSTTISGGSLVESLIVGNGSSATINIENLGIQLLPEDTLTLAAKTVSGTGATITAAITWKEEK